MGKEKYPFLREARSDITSCALGLEALNLHIKEIVMLESELLAKKICHWTGAKHRQRDIHRKLFMEQYLVSDAMCI